MGKDSALIGQVFHDTYRIERVIGTGAMGAVYEATHLRLDRLFAIKVLQPTIAANPGAMDRFQREARVTSALGHPHIVDVTDFNHTPDGRPYIVMELLAGEDLATRIKRKSRLELYEAASILRQTASGLDAAHKNDVVHRDLKPQNIFLCRRGERDTFVKLLDFGISKVLSLQSSATSAGTLSGTPYYMAPEQAEQRTAEIGIHTDVYAMGIILFEMLAGQRPFKAETIPGLLYLVVHQDPPSLRELRPDFPPAAWAVVETALRKRPEQRHPSMGAFWKALAAALDLAQDELDEPTEDRQTDWTRPHFVLAELRQDQEQTEPEVSPLVPSPSGEIVAGLIEQKTDVDVRRPRPPRTEDEAEYDDEGTTTKVLIRGSRISAADVKLDPSELEALLRAAESAADDVKAPEPTVITAGGTVLVDAEALSPTATTQEQAPTSLWPQIEPSEADGRPSEPTQPVTAQPEGQPSTPVPPPPAPAPASRAASPRTLSAVAGEIYHKLRQNRMATLALAFAVVVAVGTAIGLLQRDNQPSPRPRGSPTTVTPEPSGTEQPAMQEQDPPPRPKLAPAGRARPAPTSRKLWLTSNPTEAWVLLDGKLIGVTPLKGVSIDARGRKIVVTKPGYEDWVRPIERGTDLLVLKTALRPSPVQAAGPTADRTTDKATNRPTMTRTIDPFAEVEPKRRTIDPFAEVENTGQAGVGKLRVFTLSNKLPTWARVYVDGKTRGRSPLLLDTVAAGAHVVEVRREGFRPKDARVRVTPGKTTTITFELAPE